MSNGNGLVLASASPRRLGLLQQAGIEPQHMIPAQIDETPKKSESARRLCRRLACEKALAARQQAKKMGLDDNCIILAADTVVSVGPRLMPKAELLGEASSCLRLLSGRAHRVHTGVCVLRGDGKLNRKIVETKVRFKRISQAEMDAYLASAEWRGKAGGYAIQGLAGSFVVDLKGSYTGVVGLPLYETIQMLVSNGLRVHFSWLNKMDHTL